MTTAYANALRKLSKAARACLMSTLLTGGCSSLTDVNASDIVQPAALANPAGAEVLRLGAIGLFSTAFAGSSGLTQITASGLIADELFSASAGSITRVDQRSIVDPMGVIYYPYQGLQKARVGALQAILALQLVSPTRRAAIGELFALTGYTEVFLAENLCSGVPISPIVDGEPTLGQPLSTVQMLDDAIANLDSALLYSGDSLRMLNLARVGQGRALLDLGRVDDAAAAVAAVPTEYVFATDHSASVQQNGFFAVVNVQKGFTVADREGTNGMAFVSGQDPRVPTQLIGKGSDKSTDIYAFAHYGSAASPVVLASGIEARLIEAEAALHNGAVSQSLNMLNAIRTNPTVLGQYGLVPGQLDSLSLPETLSAQTDLLFRERALWMFGTGHRHGDLRRLVRQYMRPAETVFPTGIWKDGQPYGPDATLTPDVGERNNSNYVQCASRAA